MAIILPMGKLLRMDTELSIIIADLMANGFTGELVIRFEKGKIKTLKQIYPKPKVA